MDMAIVLHDGLCGPTRHRSAMSSFHDTTRLVGLATFSGSLRGSSLVPSKWLGLIPPTSGYPQGAAQTQAVSQLIAPSALMKGRGREMPKNHKTSRFSSSDRTNKSPVEVIVAKYGLVGTVITALLGLLGIAITAYFTYLATRVQVAQPIEATQTFEPRLATSIQHTSGLTVTPNQVPSATYGSTVVPTVQLATLPAIACITDQQESGTPAKVRADSLFYSSTALGRIQELPLVSGQKIPFSSIKSFDAVEIHEKTIGGVKIAATLLNGDMVIGVVVSSQYEGSSLTGTTEYGSFELRFLDVKRVEFREEGNCD